MSSASGGDARGRLYVWLQHALPQHGISRCVLMATRVQVRWFKNLLIRAFLAGFAVDMSEAVETDPYRYASFNDFFTRALAPTARPIAPGSAVASPVDGTVSECGTVERGELLQAKGQRYALADLLAQQQWARRFEGGAFATIYLAPFNYHRIHMPVRGRLLDTVYVPGRLFSVNATTARYVPRLFARNERVLTLFEGEFGQFAVVMVGALNVGSISTAWAGDISPAPGRVITSLPCPDLTLEKGAELGRFNMGSTVIVLFEADRTRWHPLLRSGSIVRFGQSLGGAA